MRRLRRCLRARTVLALALLVGGVHAAVAQSPAGPLIQAARAQLEAPNPDSAATLLERALLPATGATAAEQTQAFVLYGIAQLMREDRVAARQAFRQALRLNSALRIDSLYFFHDELEREFAAERAAVAPAAEASAALTLAVEVPADTTVSAQDGRLRITTRPTHRARVVTTVAPADAPTAIVWIDTAVIGAEHTVLWDLRGRDSSIIVAGRYSLRVTANDSLGQLAPVVERLLVVSRLGLDATPVPPALLQSAFAPETLRVHPGSRWWLVGGLTLSLALAANRCGAPDCSASKRAVARATDTPLGDYILLVPLVVSAIPFLAGHHSQVSPENIRRNQELRARRARAANAPIRIHVEGTFR